MANTPTVKEPTNTTEGGPSKWGGPDAVHVAKLLKGTHGSEKIQASAIDGLGGMDFKGEYNANTDSPHLDSGTRVTIAKGDVYVVTTGGNFYTQAVASGDLLIAKQATADALNEWVIVDSPHSAAEIKTLYEGISGVESFTTTLKNKLDGIEAGADHVDAANVNAAGATMNNDTSVSGNSWVVDEDNMASNSNTKVPTQQSVKTYADTKAAGTHTHKLYDLSLSGSNNDAGQSPAILYDHLSNPIWGFNAVINSRGFFVSRNCNLSTGLAEIALKGITINGLNDTFTRSLGLQLVPQGSGIIFGTVETLLIPLGDEASNATTGKKYTFYPIKNGKFVDAGHAQCTVAPVGASIIVNVKKNGTTIYTTKPTISAGQNTNNTGVLTTNPLTFNRNDKIEIEIDQVGSTTPGKGVKWGQLFYYT